MDSLPIQSTKVVIINAVVTFVQAAVASLLVADGINRASLAGAAGAALSVVWNTILKPYMKSQGFIYKQVEATPVTDK